MKKHTRDDSIIDKIKDKSINVIEDIGKIIVLSISFLKSLSEIKTVRQLVKVLILGILIAFSLAVIFALILIAWYYILLAIGVLIVIASLAPGPDSLIKRILVILIVVALLILLYPYRDFLYNLTQQ